MMNRLQTALGGFGILATLFGLGLLLELDPLLSGPVESVTDSLASVNPLTLMLVLGLLTGLLIAVTAWPRSTSTARTAVERQFDDAVGGPPDAVGTAPERSDLLGAELELGIRQGGEQWHAVRSSLFETAVRTYAQGVGARPATARAMVESGDWTEDSLAAGVLRGDAPPLARLRLWLAPERERRRRVERTLEAIEQLHQYSQGQR